MIADGDTQTGAEATPSTRLDPKVLRVMAVVFLGPFMTQIDSTVVNVSLSTIRQDLHSSIASTQWIISGYLLALALMLPLNGWLVDRVGAKRLYLICFSAFTLASALCGSARTMDELIAARVIQGMAGGLLAPMTSMMIARVAGKQLARAMGYTTIPVLVAPILGPVLAGAVLKYASWPWLFYINLPVGAVAVTVAAILLPSDEAAIQKRRFDLLGFLLISPGLACLLDGLEQASHRVGQLLLSAGALLLATFVWHARRQKSAALVDLDLFKNRVFATATRTQFLATGTTYAGQFLVPLYLTTGRGMSAAETGWLLAPMGLGMMCSYPLMGFFTERFGCRAVATTGVIIGCLGTLPFLWMIQYEFSLPLAIVALVARGAGQGATGIPSGAAAYASVPKDKLAVGATAISIVQRLGGPIATTLMAIVMSSSATHFSAAGAHTFLMPFIALVILQLTVLSSACFLPVEIPHSHQDERELANSGQPVKAP